MQWLAFASTIPDDLPITKELVEKTTREASKAGGGMAGLALTGLSIAGLLSGVAELERQLIDVQKRLAAIEGGTAT